MPVFFEFKSAPYIKARINTEQLKELCKVQNV